ncbi:STAS/SEC14 domain-containing protein [Hymenobacter sp. H14-R3]|uniref:STAS/SEC14 domain-containing protein n=1 Tax=Hymenobacter sp. H14-R3 TaxID=3046308 RepID=UPI0024B886E1|nr:STAS/SEC14 domain-containing protein [Hymenobacter sp. H14-R3]MDJ0366125.1 STAS/SEC14 domain-containing protein [Hymenobacter sp. H14-R3]
MAAVLSSSVFFENAAGRVLVDPAGFVRSYWGAQPRTLADTQALLLHLTRAMQRHSQHRVLSNQQHMHPLSTAEQAWVAEHWLPQAVHEAGYRACAVVLATNLYARLAMAYVTTSVKGLPMRYRSFDNEAEAQAWLLKQA